MVTSSGLTDDIRDSCHLIRSSSTSIVPSFINNSHQYHYSIVKQESSLPLSIAKVNSPSSSASLINHESLAINDNERNFHHEKSEKLKFSIEAILNCGNHHMESKGPSTHVFHSISSTTIDHSNNDNGSIKIAIENMKKVSTTGKAVQFTGEKVPNLQNNIAKQNKVNIDSTRSTLLPSFSNESFTGPFKGENSPIQIACLQEYHDTTSSSSPPITSELIDAASSIITGETNDKVSNVSNRRKCLSRGPRIPFTSNQVNKLESKFNSSHYLSSREVLDLACELNISEQRVKIWFQNRRARHKKTQMKTSTPSTTTTTSKASTTTQQTTSNHE